jgi:transcriptional regulator with XRE-family HTH domain
MARAALGWGIRTLADKAGVTANTVSRFENGAKANASTMKLIRQTFEAAGVRFTDDGGIVPPENSER